MSTKGVSEGRRAIGTNQRARGLNERALGVSPRQEGRAPRQCAARAAGREPIRRWPAAAYRPLEPCPLCQTGLDRTCPRCHGDGYVQFLQASTPACPACDDTGWEPAPGRAVQKCRQCGWWRRAPGAPSPNHPLGRPDRPNWRGPLEVPAPACSSCHDSGWVRADTTRRRRYRDDVADVQRWVRCNCGS